MDRSTIINEWKDAAKSGSLLTIKHDPNYNIMWSDYRSVLTPNMSASLQTFIESEDYIINHYTDAKYPNGAGYFEVIPNINPSYSVTGLGIPSGSVTPRDIHDRLVLVSGSFQGWHIYSEDQNSISSSVSSGRLNMICTF